MLRFAIVAASAIALVACATPAPPLGGANATAAIAMAVDAGRPADDVAKDAVRKPAETLAFAGVTPGQTVAEMLPGGGYFTRLLSKAVGPNGRVIALVSAQTAATNPAQIDPVRAIVANPAYANVTVETPAGGLTPSVPVDVVFTAQNYHDIHAYFGAEVAAQFNRSVYASLKPGGTYLVIDHSSVAGAGASVSKTLHRIEASTVKAEILAAGFVFDGESPILANSADPRTAIVFDPAIRGHTDQFMMRFKKPG